MNEKFKLEKISKKMKKHFFVETSANLIRSLLLGKKVYQRKWKIFIGKILFTFM